VIPVGKTSRALPSVGGDACARSDASLVRAFDLLGRRWTGVILGTLRDRPASFRELARAVEGISDSMLSTRLGGLTPARLVTPPPARGRPRQSRPPTPPPTRAARCCRRSSRSAAGRTNPSPPRIGVGGTRFPPNPLVRVTRFPRCGYAGLSPAPPSETVG